MGIMNSKPRALALLTAPAILVWGAMLPVHAAPAAAGSATSAASFVPQVGTCATIPAATCAAGGTPIVTVFQGTPDSCFGCPTGTQQTNWDSETSPTDPIYQLKLPRYRPTTPCEQLIQVDIEATGNAQGRLRIENRNLAARCVGEVLTLDTTLEITALIGNPSFTPLSLPSLQATVAVPTLSAFDGTVDFGNCDPALFPPTFQCGSGSGYSAFVQAPSQSVCRRFTGADTAFFIDTDGTGQANDNYFFSHKSSDSSSHAPCGTVTFESDPFASLEVKVTYTVCRFTPPNLVDDTRVNTCRDTAININVFANDTASAALVCPTIGTSTGITVTPPSAGTATWFTDAACVNALCNTTCIRFVPAPGSTTAANITYTVTDINGCTDSASVPVNVRTPPNLANDSGSGCQGGTIDVCVFANDSASAQLNCPTVGTSTGITNIPAGWNVTWQTVGSCAEGANTCTNLAMRIIPPATFTGALGTPLRYTLTDSNNCTDFADVGVTVFTPPNLVNDSGSGCQGSTIDVCVFANDTATAQLTCPTPGTSTGITNIPAGWTVTWQTVASCAEGALTCTNLAMRIVPPATFTGALGTPLRYTLTDSNTCTDFADVGVTVFTPPNLVNDSGSGCQGSTIDVCVFANDTATAQLTCPTPGTSTGITNIPAGWSVTWQTVASCAEGALTCTNLAMRIVPPATFTGALGTPLRYTLSDSNTCSDFADVGVTVFTPPNLVNDAGSGCPGSTIDVCVFANDTATAQLTCPAPGTSTGITNIPAGWSVTWQTVASCAEGALTCTNLAMRIIPPATFTGTLGTPLRYTLTDSNTCTDFADVGVTVFTPPNLVNDSGTGCPGGPIDVCVFANDTATAQLTCPAPGTSTGITNIPAGWNVTWQTVASCAEGALTCTNLAMRIIPPATFTGALGTPLRYTLSDSNTCTDFADVGVTVFVPPNLANDSGTGCPGGPIDVCVFANDTATAQLTCPAPGTSTGITNIPAGWTVTWQTVAACAEGALTCNNLAMRIVPPATFTGALGTPLRYTLSDSNTCSDFADVAVTVFVPPNLANDSGTGCQGTPIDVCVFANDTATAQLTCPAPGTSTGITNIPAGWNVTWQTVASCAEGALTCNNLAMRIVPPATFIGALGTPLRYTLTDANTCSDFADVAVTVCRTLAGDDNVTLCIGSCANPEADLNFLANDSTTCGSTLQCPTVLGPIPPQISVTPVSCGGPNCAGCVFRIRGLSLPPGPPPFSVFFDYTIQSSTAPFCTDTARVTVNLTSSPTLCDLEARTKPPGDTTPITFDVYGGNSFGCPGADPGPGCTFTFGPGTLEIIAPFPSQGSAVANAATGDITYTPEPTFSGVDRICYRVYNSCGCCDEACIEIRDLEPCPTANRLECGSLLLFPEFDNSTSNLVLATITDGCCATSTSNVKVEIIFINKDNCLETNRTYTLTPCDTLSFVTSAIGPAGKKGYFYAYAKNNVPSAGNPLGTPIVYNHLIGQEIVMSGITQFEYAVNAVSFKGFGAEGAPNDDDLDGIRDLNGARDPNGNPNGQAGSEYDQAPDQILIPRFLGQDSAATANAFQSDIVLVNLSGGSAFTTTLAINVFNDNEISLSDQFTFYCWAKVPLRTFSTWTLESSLKGTDHNPLEVRGFDGDRESGWILIDGEVASSSVEDINDPAFYAVLIERFGGRHAADLPFELCVQDNGDLLPRNLLGDGPSPSNDDDQ